MPTVALAFLYMLVYLAGWSVLRSRRVSVAGLALLAAVTIPSLLQLAEPRLLDLGRRDVSAVWDGEWWRLFTSMFLQDGGLSGTAFNLVALAISVLLVGPALGGPLMIGTFVVGGAISNVFTATLLHQSGAGNSMATMCMVVLAAVIVTRRTRGRPLPLVALVAVAVGLIALRDQHGFAVALGLVAGFAWRVQPDQ